MNEEFEKYQEMAKTYLAKKERVNYYETLGYDEPYPDYVGIYTAISDDEVAKIRELRERYGEEFTDHLNEVIDDEDVIHDMFYGEPADIDLDTVYHLYRFTLSEVHGDKVSSRNILIQLSDEEYCKLLAWHLYDSHLVINTLFYRDEELARKLMRSSMNYFFDEICPMIDYPYVIVMDEALDDADIIRKENGLTKENAYLSLVI